MSSAAANRVLAVAFTLADLTGPGEPGGPDLAEALHLHGVTADPGQLR
jgi:predicted ATPase with chaperone activity